MIYELRRYKINAAGKDIFIKRFLSRTMPIFERLHIKVVQSWFERGPETNFYYLLSFENEQSCSSAWNAFSSDPEWQRIKSEPTEVTPLVIEKSSTLLDPVASRC